MQKHSATKQHLMTATEARYGLKTEITLADQMTRIDREFAAVYKNGFLDFSDGSGAGGCVDARTMTGDPDALCSLSYTKDISADAFEAVAARMWRNMEARAEAAAMLNTVLTGDAEEFAAYATSPECAEMRRKTAAGAYGEELAGHVKHLMEVSA